MKKTRIVLSIICSFSLTMISCNEKKGELKKYTITGQVTGFPNDTKLYLQNHEVGAIIDSAIVNNNTFVFKGELPNPPAQIALYANKMINDNFVSANLFIGNEDIEIKGDVKDFPWSIDIKGSKTQDELDFFLNITKDYYIERDSLVKITDTLSKNEQRESIWKKIRKIDSVTDYLNIEYIKSHPNTLMSIINLGYLKDKLPKDTIQQIFDKYSPEIKKSKYAKVVEVFLRENILKIGDKFYDFEGINQKGEKVVFSKVHKKYSLLDFTTAYCGPCIQSIEELKEVQKTYSDSLNIFSFSGDFKKELWLKSLDRDKISWTSIWDGKGTYSETIIKYGVQGYPTFILINPNGTIIDKWTGYGKGSLKGRLKKSLK